ncbi:MAG: tyrosine-type recombinase/integrase [Solirubrobacterales bacterium]
MDDKASMRRPHGTGTLYVQARANGREVWYGRWYLGGRRVNRRLGPKLHRGAGKGLNRTQAEAELRRLMVRERPPEAGASISFASTAELMLRELESLGRKATTLDNYRAILRAHLLPRFGELMVNRVRKSDVESFMTKLTAAGKAERTRSGIFKLLSQVFTFAERQGWCEQNPCRSVRGPRVRECSEIRYLSQPDFEALIAAVDVFEEPFGSTDGAIFLTAAMTGMRQGELLALRWRDVDWEAERIRVRRNYTRGHWSTPKSRSGERSTPLASRVADELRAHQLRSRFSGEDDLVFANPLSGEVLPHGPLVRRFRKALKAAGVRRVRFHDLRHTFGTRMAASPDVPMRKVQEWMGHRDYRTTLLYADYEPGGRESALVDAAFASKPPADRGERIRTRINQRLLRLRKSSLLGGVSRSQRLRARHVRQPDRGPDPR